MSRGKSAPGAEDILRFYDARGYRNSVGKGQRPAIVVVDFSNAFTRGASQCPGGDFANETAQTRRLLAVARELGLPVFFTTIAYADPEKESGLWGKKVPWLSCCKLGSDAVAIDTVLDPRPDEAVIVKKFPSAFFETNLQDQLHALGVDTIVLAGCTTSVCVRATAVDAMQRNFRTLVAAGAVGDFDPALHAVHLRDIDARYADVMSVDDLLAYFQSLPRPSLQPTCTQRSKPWT
jgi:nicotinamidase-related amidase